MIALLLAVQVAAGGTPAGGSVSGRVTGPGEAPVAGADVRIASLGRSTIAASDGRYRLDSLPDGRWLVEVEADGFLERGVVVRITGGADLALDVELEPRPVAPVRAGTVAGVVLEEGRLEPVHFALVEVVPLGRQVLTDEDGLFSVGGVPSGAWVLRVSAPGYVTLERALPSGDTGGRVELHLAPRPLPLEALIVRGDRGAARVQAREPEAHVVDSALVSLVPAVVERDVLRTVQVLPSVTPASDFSTAGYVRGGALGQTRIVLDGTPLHNPFHVGGFVSAFEPSGVDASVLRPGALPASASSGLSGLVEVHTRDGGRDSVRVSGAAGLLSSALTASGPWRHGSWLLSGRRTYVDAASGALRRVGLLDESFPYGFWDLLGKLTTDLGGRGRSLTVSGYLDREGVDHRPESWASWGSDALSARFRGLVADGLTLEAAVATSGFDASGVHQEATDTVPAGSMSDFDAAVRTLLADVSVQGSVRAHLLSTGVRVERTSPSEDFDPRGSLVSAFAPVSISGRYGTTALFVRDRWRVGPGLAVDGGVRAEKAIGRTWTLLPRGRVELGLGAASSVSLGGGTYVQDWWSLRNEEGAMASIAAYDVTLPVPGEQPLSRAWDAVLELRTRVGGWAVRADAFTKRMRDVPTAPPAAGAWDVRVTLPPDSIRLGEQHVDGVELFATGALRGSPLAISYRLQRERSLLDGRTYVPHRARTHRLVLNGRRSWGEREIAVAFTWMSGRPYTPALAALPRSAGPGEDGRLVTDRGGAYVIALGEPNSAREPAYLRVDVDVRGAWDLTLFGRPGTLEPYLSLANVLNGKNPLWVDHVVRDGRLMLEVFPQLLVLPTFGIRWSF